MTKTISPFRITIILGDESPVAQVERMERVLDDDGSIIASKVLPAETLAMPLSKDIIGAVNAGLMEQVATLATERDEAVSAKEAAVAELAPIQSQLATAQARIAELEAVPESVGGVTKLIIKRRLDALGPEKWPTLKSALSTFPESLQDEWTLAQEILATDPMFTANADAFKSLLGLTDEQLTALLTP